MKFTIVIPTARDSYNSIVKLEKEHLLLRSLRSLEAQTFKDFELVVSDALYEFRDIMGEIRSLGDWSFEIKVAHPDSYWWRMGMWSLQNGMNRAAEISSGDYISFFGDCCELPPDALEKVSVLVDKGFSPSLLYVYKCGDGLQKEPDWMETSEFQSIEDARDAGQWGASFKRDSRWDFAEKNGFMGPDSCPWTWMYGYCFIPREDFFHVNGWDENFDGYKALGDVELGSRLEMAGRWKMCIDPSLHVYEYHHYKISYQKYNLDVDRAIRSNNDLILWHRANNIWKANSTYIPREVCERICRARISGHMGWYQFKFDHSDPEWKSQKHWIENQRIFTLNDNRLLHDQQDSTAVGMVP